MGTGDTYAPHPWAKIKRPHTRIFVPANREKNKRETIGDAGA